MKESHPSGWEGTVAGIVHEQVPIAAEARWAAASAANVAVAATVSASAAAVFAAAIFAAAVFAASVADGGAGFVPVASIGAFEATSS